MRCKYEKYATFYAVTFIIFRAEWRFIAAMGRRPEMMNDDDDL